MKDEQLPLQPVVSVCSCLRPWALDLAGRRNFTPTTTSTHLVNHSDIRPAINGRTNLSKNTALRKALPCIVLYILLRLTHPVSSHISCFALTSIIVICSDKVAWLDKIQVSILHGKRLLSSLWGLDPWFPACFYLS